MDEIHSVCFWVNVYKTDFVKWIVVKNDFKVK